MMREAAFSRMVQGWLRQQGAWVVKYHASAYTPKGVPDLIACYQGEFIGIELKVKSELSEWQLLQGEYITDAGGIWLCVTPSTYRTVLFNVLGRIRHDRELIDDAQLDMGPDERVRLRLLY